MDGKVIFSNDGILRFATYEKDQPAVPLLAIQEALGVDSYPFFLQQLRKTFVLEQGSTVGSFLLCLQPWAEVASNITDRDVMSYITELRKPSADEPAFDRCEVRKKFGLSQEMYHEPIPEGVSWTKWLNRERELIWLNTYEVRGEYDICGYTDGNASNWSMTTSIHKLKNVPLVINREPVVMVHEREDRGPAILNPDAAGVTSHQYEGSDTTVLICKGSKDEDMTVLDLVTVVIESGLWFNTPQGAINERALLETIMSGLPKDEDGNITSPTEVEEEDEDDSEDLTISVAPGAFDGMISHYEQEKSEWEELMDKVKQSPSLPFCIGSIEEALPLDDRASGLIIS